MALLVFIGLLFAVNSALSQELTARDAIVRYCKLDGQGAQLTASGWKQVRALFTTSGVPPRGRIMVIRDFVVSRPFPEKGKTGFIVDYTPVGWIDLLRAGFQPLPRTLEVRSDLFVIGIPGSSEKLKQRGKPDEWLIEGPIPQPRVTIDAAIRCLTELRASAKDVVIRKNAGKTIVALKALR